MGNLIWNDDRLGFVNDAICLYISPNTSPRPVYEKTPKIEGSITEPKPKGDKLATAHQSPQSEAISHDAQPTEQTTLDDVNRGPLTDWREIMLQPPASAYAIDLNKSLMAAPLDQAPESSNIRMPDPSSGFGQTSAIPPQATNSMRAHLAVSPKETDKTLQKNILLDMAKTAPRRATKLVEEMSQESISDLVRTHEGIGSRRDCLMKIFLSFWRSWETSDIFEFENMLGMPLSTCISMDIEDWGDYVMKVKLGRVYGLPIIQRHWPPIHSQHL